MFGLGNAFGRLGAVPAGGEGFTPASIAGLVFWIDPSQATTVTLNVLDVASIADISGEGHDASQGNPLRQPLYALAAINSKNAITFTPANLDNFTLASATGLTNNIPGFTIFGILRPTVDATNRTLVRFLTFLATVRLDLTVVATTGVLRLSTKRLDVDGTSNANGPALVSGTAVAFVASVNYVTGATRIKVSGNAVVTGTASWLAGGNSQATDSSSAPMIGLATTATINGTIGEWAYWNAALAEADETRLMAYAAAKWGTAL